MVHAQNRLPNEPMVLKPGEWTSFKGLESKILENAKFWTSFALEVEKKEGETRLRPDKDAPLGIHFLRTFAGGKISPWQAVMLDDLPTGTRPKRDNDSLEKALEIKGAVILTGTIKSRGSEFFRLKLTTGEAVTIEVLAQRILSDLDPYLCLLDEQGRQLAFSDDEPGLGKDSRLRFKAKAAQTVIIEVRDSLYQGSDKDVYVLRVGDFPRVNYAYASAGKQMVWFGQDADVVKEADRKGQTGIAQWYESRQSVKGPAALVVGPVDKTETLMETEPNDALTKANTITGKASVIGRLEQAGDVDWFGWEARKGEKFLVQAQTRSLGLPTDVRLTTHSADGKTLATSKAASEDEGNLTVTASSDGKVFVRVSHIAGLGGSEQGYRLNIEPTKSAFVAKAEMDSLVVGQGGTTDMKLTVARMGYDGIIEFELEPKVEGLSLAKGGIPEKKKEGTLQVKAEDSMVPGSIYQVRIQAVKPAGGHVQTSHTVTNKLGTSSTMAAVLDGWISVAIKEKAEPKEKPKAP